MLNLKQCSFNRFVVKKPKKNPIYINNLSQTLHSFCASKRFLKNHLS